LIGIERQAQRFTPTRSDQNRDQGMICHEGLMGEALKYPMLKILQDPSAKKR